MWTKSACVVVAWSILLSGWPALYAANRSLIGPDPGLVHPGTVLADQLGVPAGWPMD